MMAMKHCLIPAFLIFDWGRRWLRVNLAMSVMLDNAPHRFYIWDSTLRRSLVTPMAVTSPPAPAPWMIRGLLPYRLV